MSKSALEEDDRQNPKLAASCLDFLLIELVPMAYRIATDLHLREEALMAAQLESQNINTDNSTSQQQQPRKTLPDRTSQISNSAEAGTTSTKNGGGGKTTTTDQDGGATGSIDDEETRDAVFYKLDALGYRVGQGLAER